MDQNMEKNLLRNVKKFRFFFVQLLIMGIFANSLLPQACFCGEACLHGLQGKAKTSLNFIFHSRCSGSQCNSCNSEDGQTIRALNAAHSAAKIKTFNSPFILLAFADYRSNINPIKFFFFHLNGYVEIQSPPAYLRNLSLLL
jgi:hypothetical protein